MKELWYDREYAFLKRLANRFHFPLREIRENSIINTCMEEQQLYFSEDRMENQRILYTLKNCEEDQIVYVHNVDTDANLLFLILPGRKEKLYLCLGHFSERDYETAYGILAEFAYCLHGKSYRKKQFVTSLNRKHPLIEKIIENIEENVSGDYTLRKVSKSMNVSPGHLSKLFTQEMGIPLTEYVNRKKITYGAYLLKTTEEKISAVANMCGIGDHNYFSRLFKKYMGVTPASYRKM